MSRPHLLLLCPDPVGERMSGLGIRFSELARVLAPHADVRLASTQPDDGAPDGVRVERWDSDRGDELKALAAWADLALLPPSAPHVARTLRRAGVTMVFDLYDPEGLEVLERFRGARMFERRLHTRIATDKLLDALHHGSFFVCASERQRDLWLGAMLAAGVLTPEVYDRDPTLRSVIDIVPFGVPEEAPERHGAGGPRHRFSSLTDQDEIVLWNGGVWGWLDLPAAIRALAGVRAAGRPARLVVMGASEAGGGAAAVAEARAEAERVGVADSVLFNDRWVPYAERADWLLEADCAISTHRDHLETRFSFRTRILDCLWAGLPVVCTGGDAMGDLVAGRDLGAVAAPGDDAALTDGLARVLERGRSAYAPRLRAAAAEITWSRNAAPLIRFARDAAHAPPVASPRLVTLEMAPGQRLRRAGQRVTRAIRALRRP